jgi:HD-like signal output (HDOD) protein
MQSTAHTNVFESSEMEELLLPILERLERKDFSVPTLPQVANQVLALTLDPDAHAGKLSALIQQDPILTSKIFKTANSAACGTSREIESLSQAVAWLGLNAVAGTAFALSVQCGVFNSRGYEREVKALWAHAIATGFYAKSLAGMIGKDQDSAFLCGLLHSIGKPFVVHTINQYQSAWSSQIPWSAIDTLMDQSYIEVGRQLADEWNFPQAVKEGINLHQHHSYHLATDPSNGAAITCLARNLATNHLDSVEMSTDTLRALPITAALNIPRDVLDGLLEIKMVIQTQIDSLLV